ncbi:tetratricopeptide repeat protein [Streptomyces sp. NPDC048737]|uniref:ATP-binding protein n=1 Tax=unclassified Streptomyces TaxID=2593676 RepID=UPI0034491758
MGEEPTSVSNEFSGGDSDVVVQAGTVHGGIHVHGSGRSFPPPRQLPYGVPGFVNRVHELTALNALHPRPADEDGPAVVTAITGGPGVGKTALALHWAHKVRRHFVDGDLYIDMRGYNSGNALGPEQALTSFLRSLGVEADRIPIDEQECAALFRSMVYGKKILIFIDNASSVKQIRQVIPASRSSLVLITSRSRLSGLVAREGAARVTLDVLSPQESVRLLREVIGPLRVDSEPEAARRVAQLCGCLPLALRVVGERAAGRSLLSLEELVGELVQEQDFLDALADREDELSDVRAVFSWSYKALTEESRRAFRLLGLHEGRTLCSSSAAALLAVTPSAARRRLGELTDVHLLQEAARDRYRMHDLLRSYAVEQLSAEEPREDRTRAVRRVLTWYLLSADAGRKAILPYSHSIPLVPAGEQVRPVERFDGAADAMRWFDTERENLLSALRQAVAWGQYDIAWMLPVVADGFFELGAHWSDWKHVHELGLEAARLVGNRLGEASNLLCLGDVSWRSGVYGVAAENYRRAAGLSRDIDDPWLLGFSLRGLGLVALEQGDAGARAHFEAALAVFREHGVRRGEGMSLLSLAACARARGNHAEAAALCRQALGIFRSIDDRWSEAWGALPLADSLGELGELHEAEECLGRALGTFREFTDRRSEASTLRSLGDVSLAGGEPHAARDLWRQAAALYEELGDALSDVLRRQAEELIDARSGERDGEGDGEGRGGAG